MSADSLKTKKDGIFGVILMDKKLTNKDLLTILQLNPEPQYYLSWFIHENVGLDELLLLNKMKFNNIWEFQITVLYMPVR